MSATRSRRSLLEIGVGVFGVAALGPDVVGAQAPLAGMSKNELLVRKYYQSWRTKDWAYVNTILADDFTFSSPHGDDHINKVAFKRTCWDTQIDYIKGFDLELVMTKGDFVLVKYLCHTQNGKGFRNIELHRLQDLKIESIECYFGGEATFPSAVSSQAK